MFAKVIRAIRRMFGRKKPTPQDSSIYPMF